MMNRKSSIFTAFIGFIVVSIFALESYAQSTSCNSYNQSNPFNPTITGATTISCGSSTTLTSSVSASRWYSQVSGGTALSSNNSLTITPAATTTYYVGREIVIDQTQTFNYTGSQQSWVVPAGVTSISFTVNGAEGGFSTSNFQNGGIGGKGGRVSGTLAVTPGQTLYFFVGGKPTGSNAGWNGGGNGNGDAAGGGGASDIRVGGTALSNRAVVAAGGGGGGCYCFCCFGGHGGDGGGLTGESGVSGNFAGGSGGSQTSGGSGGNDGTSGLGGNTPNSGGGGGGGYYGGGSGYNDSGGGGGSSYTSASASGVIHTPGIRSGDGLITISYQELCASSRIAVPVTVNSIAAPSSLTSNSPQCNEVTITRSGNPAAGITWYWQGTNANGTSTNLGSGSTYSATASGTYYLRAQNANGCWSSSSSSISITVLPSPSTPVTPIVSQQCTTATITTNGVPPFGVSWYWQGTNPNGTTISNFTPYTANSSGTYYLRALNSSGCWSVGSASVTITLQGLPPAPSTPTSNSPQCSLVTLNHTGTAPTSTGWYWQGTNSLGTSTEFPSSTYGVTLSGTYYLRAYSSYGCWSQESAAISVIVAGYPQTPPVPTSNSPYCESVTISRSSIPPAGTSWYWQGTNSNGTSTSNSAENYIANSSGTYYLRARNEGNCWSNSSSAHSVVVLNNSYTESSASGCNEYTDPAGITYFTSGIYSTIYSNTVGCDSIVDLVVNIFPDQSEVDHVLACESYTWINGITYSSDNNTATYTLETLEGCDSLITLNLDIEQPSSDTLLIQTSAIDSYSFNDSTYTESGTYFQYEYNEYGCAQVTQIDVFIESLNSVTSHDKLKLLYPNPSENGLFNTTLSINPLETKIFNSTGQEMEFNFTISQIDLSQAPSGPYVLWHKNSRLLLIKL